MNIPPQIGDKVVVANRHQFKTTVSCVEDQSDGRVLIHVCWEYPKDDPYFKKEKEYSHVWLHDEGNTWHRANSYPRVN